MPPWAKGDILPDWIPTSAPWFWKLLTGKGKGSDIRQLLTNPVGWLAKTIAKWFVSAFLWVASYVLAAVGIPLQTLVRTLYTLTGALLNVGRSVAGVPLDVLFDVNLTIAGTLASSTGVAAPVVAQAVLLVEWVLLFMLLDWALAYVFGIDLDGFIRRLRSVA